MDVREKLVELLKKAKAKEQYDFLFGDIDMAIDMPYGAEYYADYLIAHGVTVQEWISVKDRLPTIYDADADNCVLAIHKASNKRYYHWRSVADNPFDFTYWMPLPEMPKEVE